MTSDKQFEFARRLVSLRRRSLANTLAAALLGSAALASAAWAGDDEAVHTAGNVTYMSGGVGTESIDQLSSVARDFNLKLVFALKSGEYLSGVKVSIADPKGKALLDTASEGPWLLAKLPAGSYHISATFGDNSISRTIAIDTGKLKVVDFRWTSE